MTEEQHTTSLLYFMPDWLFESEELTLREKMVYSLLTGLAHGKTSKECFPSDAYIAKRLKINPTHANECLKALEKFGAISRRTVRDEANPFKTKRYIKVHLAPQKSFTNSENSEARGFENSEDAISENSEDSNKEYSNKEKKESYRTLKKSPPKEKFIDHVFMTKEEHEKLLKELGEESTLKMIKRLDAYIGSKGKKYQSHYKTILAWVMKDKEEKSPKKSSQTEGNIPKWLKEQSTKST